MRRFYLLLVLIGLVGCDFLGEVKPVIKEEFITLYFKGKKYDLEKNPGSGTYFSFNVPEEEPYIAFNGYNESFDLGFSFQENMVKTKYSYPSFVVNEFEKSFKDKVFSPEDCGLSIELVDNSKGLNETFYDDFTKKSIENKVEITDFEFKDGGFIKGRIICFVYGYNNSNKNQKEKIQIDFCQKYEAQQ